MPSYAFFDETFDEDNRTELTVADIERCDDADTLKIWLEGLEIHTDDMRAQIEARVLCGTANTAWVHSVSRALAFSNMGAGRIKRRLRSLGFTTPGQDRHILQLETKMTTLKASNAYGLAFKEAAQRYLGSDTFSMLCDAADKQFADNCTAERVAA